MNLGESVREKTQVALSFAKHILLNESGNSNLVFSPLSLQVLLSLIAAGCEGPTLDQILSFVHSNSIEELHVFSAELVGEVLKDGSPSGGPLLSVANGVWVDKLLSLKHSFKHVVENQYKAAIQQTDFRTKAVEVTVEVNSWAEKETRGLIKDVLPSGSVDSATKFILANALYFKGAWDQKFEPSRTEEYDFYLLKGGSVRVPFMTSFAKQFVCEDDGFKVLRLPYKQGADERQFSMYFFLPDAIDGLPALVEKVGSESGFIERHLPNRRVGVGAFRLPKFKISFGFEASNALKKLGLTLPFSIEGNLSKMVDSNVSPGLFVSSIFHKSFIEVNEEGTEAAAASAAVVTFGSAIVHKIDFVADHPFLFLIREDTTGVVLFVGQVLRPDSIK